MITCTLKERNDSGSVPYGLLSQQRGIHINNNNKKIFFV